MDTSDRWCTVYIILGNVIMEGCGGNPDTTNTRREMQAVIESGADKPSVVFKTRVQRSFTIAGQ